MTPVHASVPANTFAIYGNGEDKELTELVPGILNQLGPDSLHGASLTTTHRDLGEGDAAVECILRGNRVRRFKEFDPMPAPRPTVRLL